LASPFSRPICAVGPNGADWRARAREWDWSRSARSRADVQVQIELVKDLAAAAERAYAALSVPEFLKQNPPDANGKTAWYLHQDYEQVLVSRMYQELLPKWRSVLAGTETYLRDNCWAMLETFVVHGKLDVSGL
jgi:hypothetical protein